MKDLISEISMFVLVFILGVLIIALVCGFIYGTGYIIAFVAINIMHLTTLSFDSTSIFSYGMIGTLSLICPFVIGFLFLAFFGGLEKCKEDEEETKRKI